MQRYYNRQMLENAFTNMQRKVTVALKLRENTLNTFCDAFENMQRRVNSCIEAEGEHFEHFL
jgi:RNA polymerase-interacting CarD/CdnL/TRCF family regulator